MKKKFIWDEWFEKAKQVQTIEQFKELYDYLFNGDIQHTYDSAVHATSALAIAGAWLGAAKEDITGFMAAHVKFDFLQEWDNVGREVGLQVINYDKLCYPQYVENFPVKEIELDMWLAVQRACKEHLEDICYDTTGYTPCYDVRQYWGDVCNGIIPSNLVVVKENYEDGSREVVTSVSPIVVERPVHTVADMERDYNDKTSPWYDKARHEEERRKLEKEMMKQNYCSCGG